MTLFNKLAAGSALGGPLAAIPFAMHMNMSTPDMAPEQNAQKPESLSTIVQPEPISMQAVTTSLRPQMRPDNLMEQHSLPSIRPKARPFTLSASNLMKEVYQPEESAMLQERMEKTLGRESHAAVLNWDGINLSEHSQADLERFLNELQTLQKHPQDRDLFMEIAERVKDGSQPLSHADLVNKIEDNYAFSHLSPRNIQGESVAVSHYGEFDKETKIANFISPALPISEAQQSAENELMDDYVMRHENCHGIDPAVYNFSGDHYANPEVFDAGKTAEGENISLKHNYNMYMAEQFADACATLEYTIENNQDGIDLMERASHYRDAAALNNLESRLRSKNLPGKVERGMPIGVTESIILSGIDGDENTKSYFIHHDTGPSIRAMLKVGSRLTEQQKVELQADPERFTAFVKDIIEDSSLTPEEYMQLPKDFAKLIHGQGTEISPQTLDLIERNYDGAKAVIEHNLNIPLGSINDLREAAPDATHAQMNEYIKIHLDAGATSSDKGSLPTGMEVVTNDTLQNMDTEDRIIYDNTYAIMRATEEWGSLNIIDPQLANGAQNVDFSQVAAHKESFHSRNAGNFYREAGHELQEIAEPEVTFEHER
ncbi:MAG: hypothetical protein OSB62_00930 [Alphaproteobacteria bacterium]|nr:hypothetical protein [Alphaproteobacteria bacterium]